MKKDKKKNKILLGVAWFFSIIFILAGLLSFSESYFGAMLEILAGLIILPPITKLIKEKNPKIKGWMIFLVFLFFIVVGTSFTTDSIVETEKQVENLQNQEVNSCTPNWQCSSWSICSSSGKQTRTCSDSNSCGILTNQPSETQLCEFEDIEDIELSDDVKKGLVIFLLESSPYDYSVIRIVLDYDEELGNYASVGMISKGETTEEIAEQIGAGLGALYGNWKDKDYYAVALNNYVEICTFAVDGSTTRNFMDGKISSIELFLNLQSTCIPAI